MTLSSLLGVIVILGGLEGLEHTCSDYQPSVGVFHNKRHPGTQDVWGTSSCSGLKALLAHEKNEDQKAQGTCLRSHRESRPLVRQESLSLSSGVRFSGF